MRSTPTLRPLLAGLALAGLTACSKADVAPLPPATGSYKLDGNLIACRVVVYPPCYVYNGQQLLVRLFTTPTPGRGDEYLDLSFVKQPTEPDSAYKINWARYNSFDLPSGGMLLQDALLKIKGTNAVGFSGTASGTALYANPTFHSIAEANFANARF